MSFCGFAPVDDPQILLYVVVDVPHVEDQPHSTYASGIFQKIMSDILPYLNIFPETETPVGEDAAGQLPDAEGITENTEAAEETPAEESKVYETEEYVDPDMNLGIPEENGAVETSSESQGEESGESSEEHTETAE